MKRLRWKLLAAMIALVVVTLGISGLFTRRVAREQVVRLMETQPAGSPRPARSAMEDQALRVLEAHLRSTGGWRDIDAVLDQLSAAQRCRIILTTTRGEPIAVSAALRTAKVSVDGEDRVTVTGVRSSPIDPLVLYVMPLVVRDATGHAVARAFVLPELPVPDHDSAMLREIVVEIAFVACGGPRSAPAGHPRTDLIPRAMLFGNPERREIQVSPDGTRISWLAPRNGVMNLWVAPIDRLDEARPVTVEQTRPIRQYVWAYTSKHLVYSQDSSGDANFHLFRVDLGASGTANVTDLTPYPGMRCEVAGMTERQPTTLMVTVSDHDSQLSDLYKVDLLSGKRTLVVPHDGNLVDYTLDDDLELRLATRLTADGGVQLLVPETTAGKISWKTFDTISPADSDATRPLGIAPGGKAVYMTDSRGRDTAALVLVDLASKQQTVLAVDPRADAGAVLIHPTRRNLQAIAFTYQRTQWKVLDPSIQSDLDALARLDGGEVRVVSRTLDDRTWIAVSSSDQHPGNYYLWDRTRHHATLLFASQPALDRQPLVKMWPVVIESRDHLPMVSYLSLPAASDPDGDGKANQPVPMVLLVHGGPWGRDRWGYSAVHQMLANRGYAVLSVNFRGSGGFGKKFLDAGNLEWGKAMHQDLIDAVQWAIANKVAPSDKVAIMGSSYGGYATLAGLTLTPDVFACGVDMFGSSNLLTQFASAPPWVKRRVGDPETAEGNALLTAVSPLTHTASIHRPLLIGQGTNDPRVKQAESEQIVQAMKDHHLPVSYLVFPDEGHGFARASNSIAFYGAVEAFLSAYLGGSYVPLTPAEINASSLQVKEGKDGIPGL